MRRLGELSVLLSRLLCCDVLFIATVLRGVTQPSQTARQNATCFKAIAINSVATVNLL